MYIFLESAQYSNMKKINFLKWVNLVAFGLLLLGGINFLMMGLFHFDLFAAIFGGTGAVVSRVFYSIFGLSALTLLATILWKAFMGKKERAAATRTKTAN